MRNLILGLLVIPRKDSLAGFSIHMELLVDRFGETME